MVRRDQGQFNTRGSRGCGKQHATTTLAHLFKSKFELDCPRHDERRVLHRTLVSRLEAGPILPIFTSPGLYWVLPLEPCRHHEISFT